jgi:hypothetical protein
MHRCVKFSGNSHTAGIVDCCERAVSCDAIILPEQQQKSFWTFAGRKGMRSEWAGWHMQMTKQPQNSGGRLRRGDARRSAAWWH